MVCDVVQALLLLREYALSRHGDIGFHRVRRHLRTDVQPAGRLQALVIGQERLPVGILAHVVLHVPCTRTLPVLVVPVLDEGVHHGADVVQDIRRIRSRSNQAPHPRVVSQPSGAPDVELPFGGGSEPEVPERGMGLVGIRGRERHLQLPGELHRAHHAEEMPLGRLGIGIHVEELSGIHSGKRSGRHVAGIVPASALGDDTMVQRLVHDLCYLAAGQVMELDGLAGGGVDPADPVLPHR